MRPAIALVVGELQASARHIMRAYLIFQSCYSTDSTLMLQAIIKWHMRGN